MQTEADVSLRFGSDVALDVGAGVVDPVRAEAVHQQPVVADGRPERLAHEGIDQCRGAPLTH